MNNRPDFIKHWTEIEETEAARYDGSLEELSFGAPFGRLFGFTAIGIHHERLPPGHRTSWPHAEKTEEEFVYVLEGAPDVWLNGELHRLKVGEGVVFVPGTGIAHTFMNNTESDVRLLVVGERRRPDNKVHYPLDAKANKNAREDHWADAPTRLTGEHDGLPDLLRATNGPF